MSKKENGGTAFPCSITNNGQEQVSGFHGDDIAPGTTSHYAGMSLRDYFAAKTLTGLQSVYWDTVDKYDTAQDLLECMSQSAYEIADAMLAERAKGESA